MLAHHESIGGKQTPAMYSSAVVQLKTATRLAPTDLHYLNYLARVYKISSQHREAIELFKTQIRLDGTKVLHTACEIVWLLRRIWGWQELEHWTGKSFQLNYNGT